MSRKVVKKQYSEVNQEIAKQKSLEFHDKN